MKNIEPTAVSRAPEREEFANRKLIRPNLRPEIARSEPLREPGERPQRSNSHHPRKAPPPEQTHAENFYYQKQMQSRTPMVVVLHDGEELRGVIEWYDKDCLKLNRGNGQSNILVYKPSIKYLYKSENSSGR